MDAATEVEIKQKLTQLSDPDRRSIAAFLYRLRQTSDESMESRSCIMEAMDSGEKTRLADVLGNLEDT